MMVIKKDSVIFELRIAENSLRNAIQLRDFQVMFYREQYQKLVSKNKKTELVHWALFVAAATVGYFINQKL
jgi:hypothetical protein